MLILPSVMFLLFVSGSFIFLLHVDYHPAVQKRRRVWIFTSLLKLRQFKSALYSSLKQSIILYSSSPVILKKLNHTVGGNVSVLQCVHAWSASALPLWPDLLIHCELEPIHPCLVWHVPLIQKLPIFVSYASHPPAVLVVLTHRAVESQNTWSPPLPARLFHDLCMHCLGL